MPPKLLASSRIHWEIRNNEINYIQKLILSKCLVKTNLEGHPVLRFIAFSFLISEGHIELLDALHCRPTVL
ncbi:hypothetical protein AcW1_005065 [Taiwanofungus camphoratus]|nr:hypothetical protein AcW1_005065 [Antrodia cinnamomea]